MDQKQFANDYSIIRFLTKYKLKFKKFYFISSEINMITTCGIFIILSVSAGSTFAHKHLYPVYNWKYLDFEFPDLATRYAAIANREYIIGNPFPLDIDVHFGGSFNKIIKIDDDKKICF